jgi:uncharacterized membrane protein
MIASQTIQTLISGIALASLYGFVLWRVGKRQGNKVIEFGALALGSVYLLFAALKVPNLPDWVVPSLGILFLLLSALMVWFLMRKAVDAIRRRKGIKKE